MLYFFEPMTGLEPVTSSLPRKCSTAELHWQYSLSGRRGSNPRPSAWKADALSTELLPQVSSLEKCGRRWIRTTEGISQQIYSLPHLATLVFAQHQSFLIASAKLDIIFDLCKFSTKNIFLSPKIGLQTTLLQASNFAFINAFPA